MKATLCKLTLLIILLGCAYSGEWDNSPSPYIDISQWHRKASIYKNKTEKLADFDVVLLSCKLLKGMARYTITERRLNTLEAQELEEEYFYTCQTYYQFLIFVHSKSSYFENNLNLWNIFLAANGSILKPYKIVEGRLNWEEKRIFSPFTKEQTRVYRVFFIRAGLSDATNIHLEMSGIIGRVGFSWKLH